ncbi:MAG: MBL fold metallo-hydrolase [Leptolinea sp.]|jgi:L-ascorbate metabolism protein UlaG (beta-lactamase superfamily)|nr:MBL fold metallo-hydrolase [Leptolinea sp.]
MQIQSIRNATMRIAYHGHLFVCDPYLADKFTRPSYTGKSPNPLIDLPMPAAEVIAGAEFFLLSHLHSDHFDPAAADLLPRDAQIFCQPADQTALQSKGFTRLSPVDDRVEWKGISIRRFDGQHGSGEVLNDMGLASGFVISAEGEPTILWVGDSLLTEPIRTEITRSKPDVIITHSSGAVWGKDRVLILTDAAQTIEICRLAPRARVVAVHMEALDHATVSRAGLREYAREQAIADDRLLIPQDGETIIF